MKKIKAQFAVIGKKIVTIVRWLRIRQYRKALYRVEEHPDIAPLCGVDTCWGGGYAEEAKNEKQTA